jgi:hypothetical protein
MFKVKTRQGNGDFMRNGKQFAAFLAVLLPAGLCAIDARAQVSPNAKAFEEAAVRAGPGLRCALHNIGDKAKEGVPVYTDSDGFARFYAVRAKNTNDVQRMTLDCLSEAGASVSFPVDLSSSETFTSRPVELSRERGVDRPALKGDPLKYSQAELLDGGYGLRPDPEKDPVMYQHWLKAASVRGRMLAAKRADSREHGVYATQASPWAGSVLTGDANYDITYATSNVPTLVPGGDGTSVTATAVWNGLGGFGTGSGLIQGGVTLYTTSTAASYASWREYCCGDANSNGYGGAFTPKSGGFYLFGGILLRCRRKR